MGTTGIHAKYAPMLLGSSSDSRSVIVNLDEGATLGNQIGPGQFIVPVGALGNREHDELFDEKGNVREGFTIEPADELQPAATDITVSDRQFAQVLAEENMITWDEAEAWVATGTIPEILAKKVDAIPDDLTRNRARMFLKGATTFELLHPMSGLLGQAMGWSMSRMRDLWERASSL